MNKKIIFRADGNSKTGLGHLYRLFSLAEIVKDKYGFLFLTRKDTPKNIFLNNYNVNIIPESILYDDEADWIVSNYQPNEYILVADGYNFGSEYQKKIKEKKFKLIYIDDFATEFMYADIIINHAPLINEKNYKKLPNTKLALGLKYSLLRPLFLKEAQKNREIEQINTAFVCFGGSDPNNLTLKATKALLEIKEIKKIHVVIGASYSHDQKTILNNLSTEITVHKNLQEQEMIEVMNLCNLGIAPSSTILYELSCIKMPILSGYYVDNQKLINNGFSKNNLIYNAGNINKFNKRDFFKFIEKIILEKSYNTLIKNQQKLFDGKSDRRLLNLISELC